MTHFEYDLRLLIKQLQAASTLAAAHQIAQKMTEHLDNHILTDSGIWTETDFQTVAEYIDLPELTPEQVQHAARLLREYEHGNPSFTHIEQAVQVASQETQIVQQQ